MGKFSKTFWALLIQLNSFCTSILTFDFDLILGNFWLWGLNWAFLRVGVRLKFGLGSNHITEQLLFFMFPSIQTFDFDLLFLVILGSQ